MNPHRLSAFWCRLRVAVPDLRWGLSRAAVYPAAPRAKNERFRFAHNSRMNHQHRAAGADRKAKQRGRDTQELGLRVYTLALRPIELARMRERFFRDHGHDWSPSARRAHAEKIGAISPAEVNDQLTLEIP